MIILVQVDRIVAEEAQRYVWDQNVSFKDAVHVASAVRATASALETYDGPLIKLSGRVGGSPLLQIRQPEIYRMSQQEEFLGFFESDDEPG